MKFISLSKNIDEIKDFRKCRMKSTEIIQIQIFKSLIKKIIKNEILEMMIYTKGGKVTRSEQSWKQNEKMIENDKGF